MLGDFSKELSKKQEYSSAKRDTSKTRLVIKSNRTPPPPIASANRRNHSQKSHHQTNFQRAFDTNHLTARGSPPIPRQKSKVEPKFATDIAQYIKAGSSSNTRNGRSHNITAASVLAGHAPADKMDVGDDSMMGAHKSARNHCESFFSLENPAPVIGEGIVQLSLRQLFKEIDT